MISGDQFGEHSQGQPAKSVARSDVVVHLDSIRYISLGFYPVAADG